MVAYRVVQISLNCHVFDSRGVLYYKELDHDFEKAFSNLSNKWEYAKINQNIDAANYKCSHSANWNYSLLPTASVNWCHLSTYSANRKFSNVANCKFINASNHKCSLLPTASDVILSTTSSAMLPTASALYRVICHADPDRRSLSGDVSSSTTNNRTQTITCNSQLN